MERPIIKDPNQDFALNSHSQYFQTFLSQRGLSPSDCQISDIEMIMIPSVTYTSLKDILPATTGPSPAAVISPTNNSSWNEIPIKNPLVKQAALAYLQPMSMAPEVGEKGLLCKLKDGCCCLCGRAEMGCLGWLSGLVLGTIRRIQVGACERRGIQNDEDDEEEDDEEEESLTERNHSRTRTRIGRQDRTRDFLEVSV